jgi:hypothetical protein
MPELTLLYGAEPLSYEIRDFKFCAEMIDGQLPVWVMRFSALHADSRSKAVHYRVEFTEDEIAELFRAYQVMGPTLRAAASSQMGGSFDKVSTEWPLGEHPPKPGA